MATREELLRGLGMEDDFINRPNPFRTSLNLTPTREREESIEQTIIRLSREGLPLDQISQMTGAPPDMVVQVLGPRAPQPAPTTEFGFPTDASAMANPQRQSFLPDQTPAGIGIESLARPDSPELDAFVDQGNSMTDLVSNALDIKPVDPALYLEEAKIQQAMAQSGVGLEDTDTDQLDTENSLAKKLSLASAAGAAANGIDDEDAVKTMNTMTRMNSLFDPGNPEDLKKQLEIYKQAAEIFYDVDDLKELIPQPDKSLPFMLAGAALIQSGEKGESWGSALSKAFLNYGMARNKEERKYKEKILGLDLAEKKGIMDFATNMYMADLRDQRALARALATKDPDVQLYRVEGYQLPVPLTDRQLQAAYLNKVPISGKWSEKDGVLKNFTITDGEGNKVVRALTDAAAKAMQNSGSYNDIVVGNTLGNLKLYNVDGVNQMLEPSEAKSLQQQGKKISLARASTLKTALDTTTNKNVFIDSSILRAQAKAGTARYIPIDDQISFAFDTNGNPIIGNSNFVFGALTQKDVSRVVREFNTNYKAANFNRNRILSTIDEIKSVLDTGAAQGTPLFFGVAGTLTAGGRRVINEVDQLSKIFSGKDQGWRFIQDGETVSYNKFKDGLGLGDYVEESGFGKFLVNSGLKKKEAETLVFQLALTSAMLEGQKGRDISNEDIKRFMTRAGAYATSEREFRTLLNNLEFNAIDYVDKFVDSNLRLSSAKMKNPDGEGTVPILEYEFRDIVTRDDDYVPTEGAETIGQRRERLRSRRQVSTDGGVDKNISAPAGSASKPLPGGDALSGDGQRTLHQVYEHYMTLDKTKRLAYTANLRKSLGLNSPEYKAIVDYIKRASSAP